MMKFERDVIFFDLETTGPDTVHDRIIELGAKKIKPNFEIIEYHARFNPIIPIDPQATEKHGMTNADLVNEPLFEAKAQEIFAFFQNADLAGYNIKKFDVPFLAEEFLRSKLIWNLSNVKYFDPFRIWQHFEGRTLTDAYKRFCDKDLVNAHSAMADIDATIEIATAQLKMFNITSMDQASDLSLYEKEKNAIDLAGKLTVINGEEYFTFGKYADRKFVDILKEDANYIDWASKSETFPHQTRIAFKLLKQKYSKVTA